MNLQLLWKSKHFLFHNVHTVVEMPGSQPLRRGPGFHGNHIAKQEEGAAASFSLSLHKAGSCLVTGKDKDSCESSWEPSQHIPPPPPPPHISGLYYSPPFLFSLSSHFLLSLFHPFRLPSSAPLFLCPIAPIKYASYWYYEKMFYKSLILKQKITWNKAGPVDYFQ